MEDPLWEAYRDFPLSYGFRAYWSSPIFGSDGAVLGTFGMVYRTPCYPGEEDYRLIALSTHLAGIAIERERSILALRASEERLRSLNASLEQQVQLRTVQLQRSLDHEALLKRIADRVRDSVDEDQILQAAVQELGTGIGVLRCQAVIYNPEQTTRTVRYEYTKLPSALGQVMAIQDLPDGQICCLHPQSCAYSQQRVAILAYPIRDDQETIGELWLLKPPHDCFDDLEVFTVSYNPQHTGLALPTMRFVVRNQATIPETELPHLFEKFYRVPNADPWRQGGTGLGLALLQKLVGRLGGEIQVDSHDGWVTFIITLPQGNG